MNFILFFYFIIFLDFWYVTCFVRKPIRAIRLSVKYDVRFQDRSFDVELLFDFESLCEFGISFESDIKIVLRMMI